MQALEHVTHLASELNAGFWRTCFKVDKTSNGCLQNNYQYARSLLLCQLLAPCYCVSCSLPVIASAARSLLLRQLLVPCYCVSCSLPVIASAASLVKFNARISPACTTHHERFRYRLLYRIRTRYRIRYRYIGFKLPGPIRMGGGQNLNGFSEREPRWNRTCCSAAGMGRPSGALSRHLDPHNRLGNESIVLRISAAGIRKWALSPSKG